MINCLNTHEFAYWTSLFPERIERLSDVLYIFRLAAKGSDPAATVDIIWAYQPSLGAFCTLGTGV